MRSSDGLPPARRKLHSQEKTVHERSSSSYKGFSHEEEQPSPTAAVLVPLDDPAGYPERASRASSKKSRTSKASQGFEVWKRSIMAQLPSLKRSHFYANAGRKGEKSWMTCHLAFGELKRTYRLLKRHFIKTNQRLPAKRLLPESRS